MRRKYTNRMMQDATERTEPERHPIEMAPLEPAPVVVRCPHCGSARGMEHISGGRGEPHKQCRACGAVWCIERAGTVRRVR